MYKKILWGSIAIFFFLWLTPSVFATNYLDISDDGAAYVDVDQSINYVLEFDMLVKEAGNNDVRLGAGDYFFNAVVHDNAMSFYYSNSCNYTFENDTEYHLKYVKNDTDEFWVDGTKECEASKEGSALYTSNWYISRIYSDGHIPYIRNLTFYNSDTSTETINETFSSTLGAFTCSAGTCVITDVVSATPTPTPTPSATPTPTPIPQFSLPSYDNDCQLWYEETKENGNGLWYLKNNGTTEISRIEYHGYFCGVGDEPTCGIGWQQASGSATTVDLFDYGSSFPDYAFTEHFSFDEGDILGTYTDYQLMAAICIFDDEHSSLSVTPLGKSMVNPLFERGGEFSPNECENLTFTVPVIDWYFELPDWWCEFKNFIAGLLFMDSGYVQNKLEALQASASARIPFYYGTSFLDLDLSSSLGSSSAIPDFDLTYQPKWSGGDPDPIVVHVEGSTFDPVVPFVEKIRLAFNVMLWVIFMGVALNFVRRIFG